MCSHHSCWSILAIISCGRVAPPIRSSVTIVVGDKFLFISMIANKGYGDPSYHRLGKLDNFHHVLFHFLVPFTCIWIESTTLPIELSTPSIVLVHVLGSLSTSASPTAHVHRRIFAGSAGTNNILVVQSSFIGQQLRLHLKPRYFRFSL